jgi:type III pantothenate kinase
VEIRRPAKIIGTNTVDNLQIGLFWGHVGLVDSILDRMIAELGTETKCVATGGLAQLIARESRYITEVNEGLTLEGLRLIYDRNHAAERTRSGRGAAAAEATRTSGD